MDKDLQELDELAQDTHADLQEKPKKAAEDKANGKVENKQDTVTELSTKQSEDTLTQASKVDLAPEKEAQQMTAKQALVEQ